MKHMRNMLHALNARLANVVSDTRGFSMMEMMLVVAVMAILVTISSPPLLNFLRQRDMREENSTQLQIRDAMSAMLTATGDLPADTATGNNAWYNQLAKYSNLSPNQIRLDQWNQPRMYVRLLTTQTLLGSSVSITYVTLHSKGPDVKAAPISDSGTVIVPVSSNEFAATNDSGWWKNKTPAATAIAAFGSAGVSSTSDDIMLRYTDYTDKIAAYNTTLERLSKLTATLEAYSRNAYANKLVACNGASPPSDCPAENYIHYPMGFNGTVAAGSDNANYYNSTVKSDTNTINGSTYFTNLTGSTTNDTARRTAMVNLMRLIGLPDSYCCSAIEHFTDSSGIIQETPFFYASNPRARASSTACGSRYLAVAGTTPLPARLATTYVADGTAGASCF